MTDVVTPSLGGDSDPYQVAQVIKNAGANDPGWVVKSGNVVLGDRDSALTGAPFNGFAESHSATSMDVTIDTGEGFVEGAWVARDVTTTVTLAASTANQTVYLGWDADAEDTAIIGLAGAFTSADARMPLYEFDTDANGVTAARSEHTVGFSLQGPLTGADNSTMGLLGLLGSASSYGGSLGATQGEVFRAPGGTSDATLSVNDGSGALNLAYNCYFDGSWRYTVGTEPAYRIEFADGIKLHFQTGGTAGNAITFHTYHFDDDTGDLFSDGTQFYDHDVNSVPKARLGGPAGSLTSYPLPAGDLSDGAGSGLDADLLDGKHASEIGGSGEWTVLDTHADTNTGTDLSYDSGVMTTTYDIYKLELLVGYHELLTDSQANYSECNVRVNNDSASNYKTVNYSDDGEIQHQTGRTAFHDVAKVGWQGTSHAEVVLRGSAVATSSVNENYPTMTAHGSGYHAHPNAIHGVFEKNYDTVDQVAIYSVTNATGKVRLLGKDLA